jgi:hypothetical protein
MGINMFGFCAIFVSGLCGYAGASFWSLLLAAAGLMLISFSAHVAVVQHALDKGFVEHVEWTLLQSSVNAVTATGASYVFGIVIRSASM